MSDLLLDARQLVKRFGARTAVDGVSFSLRQGESVGLLGPNGAGKTTTISMLSGLLSPDGGEFRLGGAPITGDTDPRKRLLGLVPQELALYEELTATDNLDFFGALYDLHGAALARAARSALEFVGLTDRAGDKVKTFSGGMKRRLNLAVALLHDPELLLLDEPTVGVDPQSRNAIFDNVEELRRRGKTILYTTHYMEEVERLCDRVIIMDHGRVVADDTLQGLTQRRSTAERITCELVEIRDGEWLRGLEGLAGVTRAELEGTRLTLHVTDLHGGLGRTLDHLRQAAIVVTSVESQRPSLEDIFLELTGRSLRDD
ncbi:MAG TPA: ABC transporter ATP-binding protein [Candidatus Limnocylindria bacterium]|nr:ABC transporter ATP-binding protein [Candidatus Limnocylindria bacterium]